MGKSFAPGALLALALTAALAAPLPAYGASISFSGTQSNGNLPASPSGRCAALTVTIASGPSPLFSTGTSNLGDFTTDQSHCLDAGPPIPVGAPATPYYDGLFTYSFASGDSFGGTYTGLLTNAGTMGLVDNVQHFVITGGTGIFAGATGSFLGTGQIRFVGGPPVSTIAITEGIINLAAVPEPASWTMLLAGFAAMGMTLRRQRLVQARGPRAAIA